MKIERIKKIKGFRIFHDFSWSAELPDFSRFNLVYGWNGSGKTTLSHLFTYLQGKQDIVEGEVKFQIDGQTVVGSNLSTSVVPQVRVFNRDSVDRSMFEVPNHELAPIFYLGEDSAEKQQAIEALKSDQQTLNISKQESQSNEDTSKRTLDDFCKNKALEIKGLLSSSGTGGYNNYDKSAFSTKCEKMVAYTTLSYCLLPNAYQENLASKEGVALNTIADVSTSLPDYLGIVGEVSELLKRSIVSDTINELTENPSIASWVQQGLVLHEVNDTGVQCHFCTNPVPQQRIADLESHFNDQLTEFQREIDAEIASLQTALNSVGQLELPVEPQFYAHLQSQFKASIGDWSSTKSMVSIFLGALIRALKEKREQPFKVMDLNQYLMISGSSEKEKGALRTVLEFIGDAAQVISISLGLGAINTINELIDQHNKYTANFNEEVTKARDVLEMHTVSFHLAEYVEKKEAVSTYEAQVKAFDTRLNELNTNLEQLERDVKEFVRPVEELNSEMAAYLGRDELQFQIKGNGYVISRNGHPAMNLSEGERTAIAFMYFLKTLEDTSFDMANGVVVIDDPISSLDANSMYSAFGFMKERTKGVGQLFILTHSFTFFRLVRGWFFRQPGQCKKDITKHPSQFYMLDTGQVNGNRVSIIKNLDPLLKDYESEYQYLFKMVYECVVSGNQQPLESYYGLPNMARRLLESFLTFKMPNFTASSIEKKLDEVNFSVAKKNRILRFLHVHSHYDQIGAPEHDLSLLAEAPAVLSDLIDLIKEVDREHYDGMASFFEPEGGVVVQEQAEVEGATS